MVRSFESFDQPYSLPASVPLEASRPLRWLAQGWEDLMWNPVPSLLYGLLLAIWGWALLAMVAPFPHLVTAAVSGFFLVAPFLVAGVYAMSAEREQGRRIGFRQSLALVRSHRQGIDLYAVLMVVVAVGWERISAILFALFYGGRTPDLQHFVQSVFLSGDFPQFVIAWTLAGFVLAVCVFALSAVSVPLMVDRPVDAVTAMMTSVGAVTQNPAAMTVWAVLIVILTAIGFATFLLGFVVVAPLLGHAAWHAYRDTVQ